MKSRSQLAEVYRQTTVNLLLFVKNPDVFINPYDKEVLYGI